MNAESNLLSEKMLRLVEKETGSSVQEILESEAPRVSEERDFHVAIPVQGSVRLRAGLYHTAKTLDERRRNAFKWNKRWGSFVRWLRSFVA